MSTTISSSLPTVSPAPLAQAIPYISWTFSSIWSAFLALGRLVVTSTQFLQIFSPLPVVLYLAAPLIVFIQILLEFTVFLPWSALLTLLDVLYPAYVFVGVACITGGLLGYVARFITGIAVDMVETKQKQGKRIEG
ncbi:hypothetical protein C8J56DRAFT_786377 [Mycena floridula]|nr:hypothetical protein C8J56DRAFT_786377 [Mycena floridula]